VWMLKENRKIAQCIGTNYWKPKQLFIQPILSLNEEHLMMNSSDIIIS